MVMPTLFGEQHIKIEGNPKLEGIANNILDMVQHNPELLKGDTVGDIDKKLTLAIWWSEGLHQFVSEDNQQLFTRWFLKAIDEEAVSRARRFLAERDFIRLPQSAIQTAERHRQRISRSVK